LLKRTLPYLSALALILACSGTRPAESPAAAHGASASKAPGDSLIPALVPEDEMLFSEVSEFVKLGQDGMRDSLWFQAGEDFDSALVRLSALEATDSLSPSVYAHARLMRDSVQKMLVYSVAMTGKMGEPPPFTQQFDEEMEDVPDSSVKAIDSITHFIDPAKYTLPLTAPLDPRVLQAMAVFMGPGRGYFTKWLARKSRYEELIQAKLAEREMPPDLMYLAMCESGFNPKAWSKASASGMWQFISGTGLRYGLKDDWWYDPRRDPMLATDAALDYLDDLHDEFDDWHLAMAAYNCGEGKIRRLKAQDSTRSYWQMALPQETRFYVPKILAAMIIGHDPKRYGFNIENPEPKLAFDTATVTYCLTIATIAKAAGVKEDTIISLNSGLRRWCTPPNKVSGFTLYLPEGTRDAFWKNYEALDKSSLVNWQHHIVQKGDNLGSIAARYRVSVAAIKATNKIKGNRLSLRQSLIIPLAPGDAVRYSEPDVAESPGKGSKFRAGSYRVRPGDNLFDIARRFGTNVSSLMAINGMKRGAVLRPGQRLKLGVKGSAPSPYDEGEESHREPVLVSFPKAKAPKAAKAGTAADTDPAGAAEAAEVVTREKAPRPAAAAPEAGKASKPAPGQFSVYTVGTGETIYSISRSLGVSEEDLAHWNGLSGNRIQAGQKLKYTAPRLPSEPPHSVAAASADPDGEPSDKDGRGRSRTAATPRIAPVAAAGFIDPGPEDGGEKEPERGEKQYYIVKAGDSLWDISVKYRSTVQKLKELNGKLPSVLRPGTRIRVK
jgi:membrane-bound lytic murein transglycosylase D